MLDEKWYYSCMECGRFIVPKDPYDFYCCKKCKKKGDAFTEKLGEELAQAYADFEKGLV